MWKQSETGSFYSSHKLIKYLGDLEPKYHVIEEGGQWKIGQFDSFYGEYVPYDEELTFPTAEAAKDFIDSLIVDKQ